ncbi:Crustacean calcium-binding protein 23 [Diplonema papillatum]|nr:Crustacean calcium-binding protein 23 [Diplonema papillatum]
MATREWMEDPVMGLVKRAAWKRGNTGLRQLTQAFKKMDRNDDQYLSFAEFKAGLADWGVQLNDKQVRYLLVAFDKDGDGKLSIDEFLNGLRSGLNPRRKWIVRKAFTALDADNSGFVDVKEMRARYDASDHPAVLEGEKSPEQALREFMENFEDEDDQDRGKISLDEFEAYYAGVSHHIPSDDYFDMMLTQTFGLEDEAKPKYAPRTMRPYDVYGGPTAPQRPVASEEVYSRSLLAVNDRNYDVSHMRGGRASDPGDTNKVLPHTWETTQRADYGYYDSAARKTAAPPQRLPPEPITKYTPTGDPILDKVRRKVLKRSAGRGFRGLTRVLRIMDDNGNKMLDKHELKEGFQTYQVSLTAHEVDLIFAYFDQDGNGQITVTEFVRGVRGPMTNPRRLQIVKMAFSRLDKDGSGVVTMNELVDVYDTTKHPQVVTGEKTPREALQDFIEDWDKNGDDTITQEEFIDYYGDLSAGIDDDNYFELMVRNAWHISGGTGVAANTTCRRVLVTYMSGKQEVVEIKDDLGIPAQDVPRMLKALRQQGVRDIKRIELAH